MLTVQLGGAFLTHLGVDLLVSTLHHAVEVPDLRDRGIAINMIVFSTISLGGFELATLHQGAKCAPSRWLLLGLKHRLNMDYIAKPRVLRVKSLPCVRKLCAVHPLYSSVVGLDG